MKSSPPLVLGVWARSTKPATPAWIVSQLSFEDRLMPLEAGTQLGPYEILSPLGAGGMGEVYKARDTRLDRTVAIKVLLAHVADDPDLRQRFEREAKTISSRG